MIVVVASIQVKEGRVDEFLKVFKANVPNVLAEEGCIEYLPAVDVPAESIPQELNPKVVTVVEKWRSVEDLKAHLNAPHMLDYRDKVEDMVEHVSIRVLREA
jgi:quinol monooxygenase YgiN